MSFPIPKIQWGNTTVSGVTSLGANDINFIADTSSLKLGMTIDDPEFPEGTTIITINANQIFLSNNATASSSGPRSFLFEFLFRYPSIIDDGEQLLPKRRVRTAISGVDQVSVDHIKYEREVEFGHLTEDEIDTLKNDFFRDHAIYGFEFLFFPDQNTTESFLYELMKGKFEPERLGNSDKFSFKTTFKRIEF